MPIKRTRRKKKIKVRRSKVNGLKCGSGKEARYVKECVRYKRPLPTKAKRVKTPIGFYTPDFEHPAHYVEIKSLHTLKVCFGEISYTTKSKPSDLQWRKIQWVAKALKPIKIICYLSRRESIPIYDIQATNITIEFKGGYTRKSKPQ